MVGEVLSKYRILEEIGQGGMAVVYRGLDTTLNREVAIKILHPHLADRTESRSRFLREAQAIARLRHDNILEIYDYSGEDSEKNFIVMEFIHGRTLKSYLDDHPFQIPELGVVVAVEVTRALVHAHRSGIIHRDIKPENIMIATDGRVKLMDFGIAAMVDSQKLTLTGQLLGSPAYMAPEMITGGRLDFRTDLFSLGILLYRLTVGELPFKGRSPHEVLKRIADAEYIRPGIANPRVGDDLAEIIGKTLARDPEARYQDAEQLLAALEAHLARMGIAELCGNPPEALRDPAAFEERCQPRLLARLIRLAEADIAAGRLGPAFSTLNRVLAFEAEHPVVLRLLRTLNRRQGLRSLARTAALVAGVGLLAAVLVVGFRWLPRRRGDAPALGPPDAAVVALTAPAEDAGLTAAPPVIEDAEVPGQSVFDGSLVFPATVDAGAAGDRRGVRPHLAPGRPAPEGPRSFAFKIQPPIWRAFLDGRSISPSPGQPLQYDVPPGDHTLVFRSDIAYDHVVRVDAGQPAASITGRLRWKPARLLVQANPASARVQFKSPPYLERSVFPRSGDLVMIPLPADRDPPFSARIMVYAERYQAEYRDIALVPNQQTNVTVKLTPLP